MLQVDDSQQQEVLGILQRAARLPSLRRVRLECALDASMPQAAEVARHFLPFALGTHRSTGLTYGEQDWSDAFPDLPVPRRQ